MLLGDLIINHDNKRIPLSAKQRENIEKNYPYYGAQGIIDYVDDYLFEGKYLLIAEDGENLRSRKQPIATIVEGKFWVNNHAHIVTSNELSNLEFLCFWLNSNDISEYITGSAQPKLNQNNMNLIALPDFSREEQDRIAEKLCVYEKKIKNNLVNIALLVNVANEIYKETFIQKSKLADGQYAESTVFENIIELKEKNKEEKDYPVLSVVKEGEFKASEDVFTKQVYSKSTKNYKIVRRNQVAYNPARANIGSIAMYCNDNSFSKKLWKPTKSCRSLRMNVYCIIFSKRCHYSRKKRRSNRSKTLFFNCRNRFQPNTFISGNFLSIKFFSANMMSRSVIASYLMPHSC